MGFALFTASRLFAPLHHAVSWFMPSKPQKAWARPQSVTGRASQVATNAIARSARSTMVSGRNHLKTAAHRPLRVLRVVEPSAAPASAGRMVISGRMADVCAELDRLAASEAILR